MSMISHKDSRAKLPNKEVVVLNDHVYFAPPWSERDGSPYSIARIIEFVPPEQLKSSGNSRKPASEERHVRLALFYRHSELNARAAGDHRLLLAAIHTEVHPLSWIRGKCQVRHKDRISDLQEWKKRPDHFHFSKLFDPYIKRDYEMLRTEMVRNVPKEVKDVLMSRYEFLVTEKEMVADLVDNFRTCTTCNEWASSQGSVKCESCKLYYHMTCVKPALAAKPARGYSWICLPCTLHQHEAKIRGETPIPVISSGPRKTLPGGRNKAISKLGLGVDSNVDDTRPDVFYRGWNLRYFGLYTIAADTMDDDDPIFPRNATRLGPRYQAVVPSWEEQQELNAKREAEDPDPDVPKRGLDPADQVGMKKKLKTAVMLSKPHPDMNGIFTEIRKMDLPVPVYNLSVYQKALEVLITEDAEMAVTSVRRAMLADFKPVRELNAKDLKIFEAQVEKWGSLEQHETAKLLGRSPAEVVRLYYAWRNERLKADNDLIRQAEEQIRRGQKVTVTKAKHYKPAGKTLGSSAILGTHREGTPDSDAEGSIWEEDRLRTAKPGCGTCHSKKSDTWWKTPRNLQGEYMCEHCGPSYRKYGKAVSAISAKPALVDEGRRGVKRDSTPIEAPNSKRNKVTAPPQPVVIEPPVPPAKLQPCVLCRKQDKTMARCKNCSFSIHPGCYGIPKDDCENRDWLCEPCANEKSLEAALDVCCVLCPSKLPKASRPLKSRPKLVPDFDYLQALKPTEGYKWAHILCSTFIPEIVYTDANRMRLAESIMTLPARRWESACEICHELKGAVIFCSHDGCSKAFHPACAWVSGYRFGFEFSMKSSNRLGKKDNSVIVEFKEAKGTMTPQCFCIEHDLGEREVFDLHDQDPTTGETALQIYTKTYKQVIIANSFGLLRKAKRLESVLQPIPSGTEYNPDAGTRCMDCEVDVTPRWYDNAGTKGTKICHQCWFKRKSQVEVGGE